MEIGSLSSSCSDTHHNADSSLDTNSSLGTLDMERETFMNELAEVSNLKTDSFKSIVGKAGFVDKTLFIREFLRSKNVIMWVTAPRRFGKSINMDMLRTFLSVEVDENAQPIARRRDGENYKLFQNHLLNIYTQDKIIFKTFCGRYPVIYVDFGKVVGTTKSEVIKALKLILHETYKEYSYLVKKTEDGSWVWNSSQLQLLDYNVDKFLHHLEWDRIKEEKESYSATESWEYLSDVLRDHFQRRVVILIDNFDIPILNAIGQKQLRNKGDMKWILDKVTEVVYCLILRKNRERALLNKCVNLDKPGLINHSCLECPFVFEWYGFTEEEVRTLLKNPIFSKLNQKDLSLWYGGYKVDSVFEVYSPASVLKCLQKSVVCGEPVYDIYWSDHSCWLNLEHLFGDPDIKQLVNTLFRGKDVSASYEFRSFSVDVQQLAKMMDFPIGRERYSYSDLLLYLSHRGYLFRSQGDEGSSKTNFYIPNLEMKKALIMKFLPRLFSKICSNPILA